MELNNTDMQQLREQLRIRGQQSTNATLEIKVIPEVLSQNPAQAAATLRKLQLDKKDIHDVFAMYGKLTDITIEQDSCVAYVVFEDVIDAFLARQHLDKIKLSRDDATLHVKFFNPPKQLPVQTHQN